MIRRPLCSTLFPYTTLFRSGVETNNDVAISSITDTQGNTYVKDVGFAGAPNRLSIWRASNITGSAAPVVTIDRKSTRLNSSHGYISYAVFCLKKKNK